MTRRDRLTDFEELYMEVQRKVSAEWHKRLDPLISASQALILRKLDKSGPQKITILADGLCITPGAVTSLSDKLISSGYAIRKRDTKDRRVVYLEITDPGRELLNQYRAEVKSTVKDFFVGLPDEDIDHLIRIYQMVLRNIDKPKEESCE
ncbi:MarR family winged helix-turn-helix transcriptional regulator [Hazenella coriacea]|uniref:DNA-binding MarR family transcriptional regulator n=1 Tax=Hazenella coriacea TaxID=1179467 RepID=A0A4R3L9H7_9BACL|nr:MarR family transcriptional regulator [Hazenella coriacea]TCS95878.1 DNA-binding MarR family transcriptional regulator [Hazenella coriacea]